MNYLANYYKNICEQLQNQIDRLQFVLNEAGYKKAIRSGNTEKMKKELAKRRARKEHYHKEMGELHKAGKHLAAETRAEQARSLTHGIEALAMPLELQHGIKTGVKQSELPAESPWGGDSDLPVSTKPYPTPEEMTRLFMLSSGKKKRGIHEDVLSGKNVKGQLDKILFNIFEGTTPGSAPVPPSGTSGTTGTTGSTGSTGSSGVTGSTGTSGTGFSTAPLQQKSSGLAIPTSIPDMKLGTEKIGAYAKRQVAG